MTTAESHLWTRINNFSLDDQQSGFKFSDRLARENGWDKKYTLRVIEEYKKFIFLCCISPSGITPSDAVDQAWHLHLTFTKSYWVDFCKETLQQEIHHQPTKGGNQEATKFEGFYNRTFNIYKEFFGTEPPADIWKDSATRFSDVNFSRVNLGTHVPVKRSMINIFKAAIIAILVLMAMFIYYLDLPDSQTEVALVVIIIFIFIAFIAYNTSPGETHLGSSDNSSGCGGDTTHNSHHGHDGHSGDHGCSSGCSGCSGSGCSGCGGGGD